MVKTHITLTYSISNRNGGFGGKLYFHPFLIKCFTKDFFLPFIYMCVLVCRKICKCLYGPLEFLNAHVSKSSFSSYSMLCRCHFMQSVKKQISTCLGILLPYTNVYKKKRENNSTHNISSSPLRHSSGTCHFLSTGGKGSSEELPSEIQCWRQCGHFFQVVPLGIARSSSRNFVCLMLKSSWLIMIYINIYTYI